MAQFQNFLGILKEDIGINSDAKFYDYLKNAGLSCSADEFMQMLSGKEKPTRQFIDTLLYVSDTDKKEILIKVYGEILFPQNYQFSGPQGVRFLRQKVSLELSEFQVTEIGKSKFHYYLFLLLVLKAEKIKSSFLKKQFGALETID